MAIIIVTDHILADIIPVYRVLSMMVANNAFCRWLVLREDR